ncbi:hypothetical protein OIU78_017679 [Salix suchowensis]|nr:hypothetical protein OIU78_017679 [Salix suchowensis]
MVKDRSSLNLFLALKFSPNPPQVALSPAHQEQKAQQDSRYLPMGKQKYWFQDTSTIPTAQALHPRDNERNEIDKHVFNRTPNVRQQWNVRNLNSLVDT